MRAEDKAITADEIHDLGRRAAVAGAESSVEDHLLEHAAATSAHAAASARHVFDGLDAVLRGESLADELVARLGRTELDALEAVRVAASGRDPRSTRTVYAEDRRDLLEQALATLQPLLAVAHDPTLPDLMSRHAAVVDEVTALRQTLGGLAARQALFVPAGEVARAALDEDDDDGDEDEDEEDDATPAPRRGPDEAPP
ncbi:MAG: hypothetical protein R2939_15020 [Kofleriaceae bacterium]